MSFVGIYLRTSVETDGTSIGQQKKLALKFCNFHNFQYRIYEDIGKSAFRVDDPTNPFKNLPALIKLTEDIEKKIIDKVWVFEYSRLSRSQEISIPLLRLFVKHNITVYERDKQFNFDDPTTQLLMGIVANVYQFERNAIILRTTRGLRATINTGLRTYNKIYGYRIAGKHGNGYAKWEPVDSEIDNIQYSFIEYLLGKSVDSIVKELNKDHNEVNAGLLKKNYINVLRRFDYTGFSLTTEGSELYKKYQRFEIDNLDFLKEQENGKPKYFVKSINFPVQVVAIDDWILVADKLRNNKFVYRNRKRRTNTEIFTGMIYCPHCNLSYYFYNDKRKHYKYYTHTPSGECSQKPKSVKREVINNLVEMFYFYFYLMYDDRKELLEENQKVSNLNLSKIKDQISGFQRENKKLEKQISNLQDIYGDSTDKNFVKMTLKKESELILKLDSNNSAITKLKFDLNELIQESNRDKKELTYYNVKEIIISFFEKLSVEDKRASLIKIIKKCQLFGNHLLIEARKILFVFNITKDYKLPEEIYNQFKNDEFFKEHFLNSYSPVNEKIEYEDYLKMHGYPDIPEIHKNYLRDEELRLENIEILSLIVRRLGDIKIRDYNLSKPENKKSMEKQLDKLGIEYDLSNILSVVSFTEDIVTM